MLRSSLSCCALLLAFAGCGRLTEEQLVGDWLSGCSIDICTITSLKTDHTYCDTFDEKSITEPSRCGTWRLDGDRLVFHITWEADAVRPAIRGETLQYAISEMDRDTFLATLVEHP